MQYIAEVFLDDVASVNVDATLDQLSLDSVDAMIMIGLMEEEFDISIEPAELYENPSIARFAKHIAAKNGTNGAKSDLG